MVEGLLVLPLECCRAIAIVMHECGQLLHACAAKCRTIAMPSRRHAKETPPLTHSIRMSTFKQETAPGNTAAGRVAGNRSLLALRRSGFNTKLDDFGITRDVSIRLPP